jgi:3D (Asp-Asp-Asp) domain-containing protein
MYYLKLKKAQFKLFVQKKYKQAQKIAFAVVVLECLLVALWVLALNYGLYEFFQPRKVEIIRIVHAETPKIEEVKPLTGEFSAYTAEVGQTDNDPFTMASGKKVYVGAIANNCLDFGTTVQVNGYSYTVEDRMNSRYNCNHFDIYMTDYNDAIAFGRKSLEYVVK